MTPVRAVAALAAVTPAKFPEGDGGTLGASVPGVGAVGGAGGEAAEGDGEGEGEGVFEDGAGDGVGVTFGDGAGEGEVFGEGTCSVWPQIREE